MQKIIIAVLLIALVGLAGCGTITGDEQTINVNIKPPTETVAGDYVISLRASGKQTSADEMNIRVTVETPTIWGWVGVVIILIVVIGLIVIFMPFSRR